MPSITPETLTAVQRAERLNLRQSGAQAREPDRGVAPDAMSKKQQKHLEQARAAFASSLGPQRNATAHIDPRRDADLSFAILPIDQVVPYQHNPRSSPNPRYEEIKESIRADGITNTLTVTRRSPQDKYTTYGGGNTRLKIAKELYAEGDQRFANLQVIIKDWPGDAQVIAAQLSENELRSDITFWEKAKGVHQFKIEFEAECGKPLTASELNRELKSRGLTYGIKTLQNFAFAVEHLAPLGNWLRATEVNETLRPAYAALLDLGVKLGQAGPLQQALADAMTQRADELDALAARNAELDPSEHVAVQLDIPGLLADLRQAAASELGIDAARLAAMQAALAADARISAQALRSEAPPAPTPAPDPGLGPTTPRVSASTGSATNQERPPAPPVVESPAPDTLLHQAPLPGMLAGVGAAAAQPLPADPQTPATPSQPRSEADLLDAIKAAIGHINALVPLSDVLLSSHLMPFGYLVDLPAQTLRFYADRPEPVALPGLRGALWRLLVALSGQCDARLVEHLPPDQVLWAGLYHRGRMVFEEELRKRTGTRFAGLVPAMGMDELPIVLTTQQLGEAVLALLHAMEELRRRFPQRVPEEFEPLFPSEEDN